MAKINPQIVKNKIASFREMINKALEQGTSTEYFEKQVAILEAQLGTASKNKFNAKKVEIDGIKFDSTREGEFYKFLKNKGYNFERQVSFTLMESFKLEGEGTIQDIVLTVDFLIENEFLVDVKGMRTEEFNLKWKLLKNIKRNDYVYRTIVTTSERLQLENEIDIALTKRYPTNLFDQA